MQNSSKKNISKSMVLNNSTVVIKKITQKNTFSNIILSSANIGKIINNTLDSKINISCPSAYIANTNLSYDDITDTSYFHNNSEKLVIKCSDNSDIMVFENEKININSNININGNVNMIDNYLSGDIMANNANLLGDVISTNAHITNNFKIDGITSMKNLNICGDLNIDGNIFSSVINTDILNIKNNLKTDILETSLIGSPNDLSISAGINCSVNIPNIRYNIIFNDNIIDPILLKLNKIFIVKNNIILQADESCNGIEIIIYNDHHTKVIIRDIFSLIDTISGHSGIKLVFIFCINRWIKL